MSKNNEKIITIAKYNVEKNIRNKWFIILNAILLIITVVGLNIDNIQNVLKNNNIEFNKNKISIQVVDEYDMLYKSVEEEFLKEEYNEKVEVIRKENLQYDEQNLDKNTIIVNVVPSDENMLELKIISKEGVESKYINAIEKCANEEKNRLYSNKYNLTEENINNILKDVQIERIMVGVDNKNSDIKFILQTIANYMILIILMIVLSKISNDISQEKVSKSIEYVLTSISAKSYLIAKIISISLTLIAQFILGIIYLIIASSISALFKFLVINPSTVNNMPSLDISFSNIFASIDASAVFYIFIVFIFAIFTVLILSVIQAAISSKTTNISEASNATILLMVINLVIYAASSMLISPIKQISIVTYILSCIPIVSMYFIPSMMLIGQANIFQIVIAFLILIISIPFIFKFSEKIFKEGILDYNNKKKNNKEKDEKSIRQIQEEYVIKKDFSTYGFVIGVSVILFIFLQFLLPFVITPLVSALNKYMNLSASNISSISNILAFVISLAIPTIFVKIYTKNSTELLKGGEKNKEKIDIKLCVKSVLVAVPIVVIVQIVLTLILEKLGLNYDIVEKVNLYDSTSVLSKILFFVQIAILPAIFEELYIRKAVLDFSKKYGYTFAIISSSLLFSLIHLNISQSLFAFVMGVILAVIAFRTKSIVPTCIIHFVNNGYAALVTIFEKNEIVLNIINYIGLAILILGIFVIILEIVKNKNSVIKLFKIVCSKNGIKKIKEEGILQPFKFEKNNEMEIYKEASIVKGYKYILLDYSFIVSVILVLVMLFVTQNMLSIL